MASARDLRRLTLLALYQIDARGGGDREQVRQSLDDCGTLAEEGPVFVDARTDFSQTELDTAFASACAAYERRKQADDAVAELAPDWPTHRQPAIDRAILRLAYHEMEVGVPPKVAVNEAVELAKAFSTDRSPAFINGVLDKLLKRRDGEREKGEGGIGHQASGADETV
ncbi:MAG: transcription antitermination factor NusB [Leptolyngbya sp. PLA2]|nr:transcription antitermination factor NusB [Leptolyngbya sp.]MCE7972248.1 transcription antitermination factor NusB [Leptolyngbya sp. PL-A2]MCQ3941172.1 transcription antitermination factor NusB [cyanobacterium CYA1]MCZ7633241.1 transcription antitermination factor NusB [Phycisphaerales bacterium]MDL1905456.1 transcription antitermination factor NusB [Synechococcales cyanobacterium CNB]GIK18284.1 MAG: N utilization substance protein B [Planctomycetota bacterium]